MNAELLEGRRRRVLLLTLALGAVFLVLYVLRSAIFPFALGLVLAYVMLPVVSWTERRLPGRGRWLRARRESAIALIFIVVASVVGFLSFYTVTTFVHAVATLMENAPVYTSSALAGLTEMAASWDRMVPVELHPQADQMLAEIGDAMGRTVRDTFLKGLGLIPASVGFVMGVATLPVFLFYTLKDWTKLRDKLYTNMPEWASEHVRNVLQIIGAVLGRYIRAQLFLGLVVGAVSLVGLLVLGVPYAPVLAFIAGTTELIPVLGPWIGGITAVMVTLATAPDKAVWVAALALGIQVLENMFLTPRVQGGSLNIHLAVAVVLLVVGAYVAGFWGLILILPVTAVVARLYCYFYNVARDGAV